MALGHLLRSGILSRDWSAVGASGVCCPTVWAPSLGGGVMLLLPESARLLCPWMNLALSIRLSFPDFASFLMDPVFCTTVAWGLVKPLALESSRQHPPGCYCIVHILRDHTAGLTLRVYVTREIQVRVRGFVSTLVRSALPSYPNRCRVI